MSGPGRGDGAGSAPAPTAGPEAPLLEVVAGVLRDADGRVLLARRPPGRPLAGLWEFPGGKRDPGESLAAALARELREELAVELHDLAALGHTTLVQPGRRLRLHAFQATAWTGPVRALEGQDLAWVEIDDLDRHPMPAADWPIAARLRLPSLLAISPDPGAAAPESLLSGGLRALASGAGLLQVRVPAAGDAALLPLLTALAGPARAAGAVVLVNGRPALAARLGLGLHLPSRLLAPALAGGLPGFEAWQAGVDDDGGDTPPRQRRAAGAWLTAACHDAAQLRQAWALGCDAALVSPVLATASHPGAAPLGWDGLHRLLHDAPLPVYALGGLAPGDLARARAAGAHGVAGISAFWPRR